MLRVPRSTKEQAMGIAEHLPGVSAGQVIAEALNLQTFAEKTVRSTRKKLSAISGKRSGKGFHTHSEVEGRKQKARAQLATILRQHAPA